MSANWRGPATIATCFFAGIVLHMALASDPEQLVEAQGKDIAWALPDAAESGTRAADAIWRSRWPWGKPPEPVPVVVVPPPPPPPAVPVGIIGVGKGYEALFLDPMLGEIRLLAGGRLSDGSRVTKVTANRVDWISPDGVKHHHEMLSDPSILMPGPQSQPQPQPQSQPQPQMQPGLTPVGSPA